MKKIIYNMVLLSLLILTTQCSEDKFAELYPDPSKVASVQVDRLFTGVLKTGGDLWNPDYGRYYILDSGWLGFYSQVMTGGKGAGASMYTPAYDVNGYWNNFYTALGNFRLLESKYNELSDAEKTANECFYLAAKVYIYHQCRLVKKVI